MNQMEVSFSAILDNENFARTTVAAFLTPLNPTIDEIIEYMNEYLDKKWMRVRKSKDNEHILNVESKFDYER